MVIDEGAVIVTVLHHAWLITVVLTRSVKLTLVLEYVYEKEPGLLVHELEKG